MPEISENNFETNRSSYYHTVTDDATESEQHIASVELPEGFDFINLKINKGTINIYGTDKIETPHLTVQTILKKDQITNGDPIIKNKGGHLLSIKDQNVGDNPPPVNITLGLPRNYPFAGKINLLEGHIYTSNVQLQEVIMDTDQKETNIRITKCAGNIGIENHSKGKISLVDYLGSFSIYTHGDVTSLGTNFKRESKLIAKGNILLGFVNTDILIEEYNPDSNKVKIEGTLQTIDEPDQTMRTHFRGYPLASVTITNPPKEKE